VRNLLFEAKPNTVIPTEAARPFLSRANEPRREVYLPWQAEESLFDLSRQPPAPSRSPAFSFDGLFIDLGPPGRC
jgi:hypothetical protein